MEFFKKNKIVVAIVVVVLVIAFGGFFFLSKHGGKQADNSGGEVQQEAKQMSPEDIGLDVSLRDDQKAVILTATKLDGIKTLEYELSYDAEETVDGETATVPSGVFGELKISNGVAKAEAELGTCSGKVCRYAKIVGPIQVLVKVTFDNGELGAIEDQIELESAQ